MSGETDTFDGDKENQNAIVVKDRVCDYYISSRGCIKVSSIYNRHLNGSAPACYINIFHSDCIFLFRVINVTSYTHLRPVVLQPTECAAFILVPEDV